MNDEQKAQDRLVRVSDLDKYPTRWEMIAMLMGAVVANQLIPAIHVTQSTPTGMFFHAVGRLVGM